MMHEGVSVIVRCRNHQAKVLQLYAELDRVLGQIGAEAELIFVDEGSTDRTMEYLAAIAQKDKRVRVVQRDSSREVSVWDSVLSWTDGERIIVLDGSGGSTLSMIGRLLERLEAGADWVRWEETGAWPLSIWRFIRGVGHRMLWGKLPFPLAGTIVAYRRGGEL